MVRTVTSGLLLFAVSCAGGVCLASESTTSYENLKPLEWLTGNWVGEFVATSSLGPVNKGDHVTVHVSERWILNKRFLVSDSQLEIDGKRTPDSHEIVSWDANRREAVFWGFGHLGVGKGVLTEIGDKIVLSWSVNSKDGKLKGTSVLNKLDDNSYTFSAKDVTLDGEELPEWPTVTMRRRQGVVAGDLWSEYRDGLVGTWLGTGTLNRDIPDRGLSQGDAFAYDLTWTPDLNGMAVLGKGTFRVPARDYTSQVRLIAHWDPSARQVQVTACWSNGDVEEITIQRKMRTGFRGSYVMKSPEKETQRLRIRFAFPDSDSAVIEAISVPSGRRVLSSWKRQ